MIEEHKLDKEYHEYLLNTGSLLTPREASSYLGIHVLTLGQWRKRSEGPAYFELRPRIFRYRLHDLLLYIKSKRVFPKHKK